MGKFGNGHNVRRAFRTGGIRTWGHSRAVKTNRLVYLCLMLVVFDVRVTTDDICFGLNGVQICPWKGRPPPDMSRWTLQIFTWLAAGTYMQF